MAIFRSLFLTTKNGKTVKTRPYFTTIITTTTTPSTTVTTTILYTPLSNRPTLLSKWIAPFQGPLFLSFPPWKLSQFATPLNGVVLRRVRSLNLDLIRGGAKFPPKLGLDSGLSGQNVLDRIDTKDELKGKDDIGSDGFVKSFVTLPNLVSMARLVSGPFIGWMITNELYSSAFLALAVSGATDWLDGYLARRMKIDSVVGSYLDPLADKVLIGCVALAMVQMDLLHPGLVGIVVFRDVGLVGGAIYQRGSSLGWKWKSWSDFFNLDGTCPQKVEPLFLSKVNTVFQLVLVAAALLQPEFGTPETQPYITYLSLLVASTTVASTAAYGAQYIRKRSALLTRNP